MSGARLGALVRRFARDHHDYRAAWLRLTATLSDAEGAPLDVRLVQAIADAVASPGGLLLLPDASGGLVAGARWRWPGLAAPAQAAPLAFTRLLEETERIVEVSSDEPAAPAWLVADADADAWAIVPLVHVDRLVGAVLLRRPSPDRRLAIEDVDLLRVAGRQVASYLAEARGQEALSEAKRFDEFNRRFAFVVHDIKNLVSQLSLVTRNAERHADNPAFRADMMATLRDSVDKMNELLARLSQHNKARPEEPRPISLRSVAEAAARGRATVRIDGPETIAEADPARLEQALVHLVQNALDAGAPDDPVLVRLGRRGLEAVIEVIDQGGGMSADFVRTRLFKPFASTKADGFGIGAFEARALIAAMGGRLEVESREGEGSRFAVILPLAAPVYGEAA